MTRYDVVVVGGGIAGLVATWEHARAGRSTLLLEAAPDVGGAVSGHRVGGLLLDAGADSYALATPSVTDLVEDLGLTDRVVTPNPAGAWVRHQHGSAPLPPGGLLGIPAHPLSRPVRDVLGPVGALRAAADRLLPGRIGAASPTLGGLVRTRMGGRVVSRLVEPVAGGVYSADPDALELASINPRLVPAMRGSGSLAAGVRSLRGNAVRPGSAVAGLDGGMLTLTDALVAGIEAAGGRVFTGVTVTSVLAATGGGPGAPRFDVTADGDRIGADRVVLATPGRVSANLLAPFPGAGAAAAGLATVAADEIILVTVVLDAPSLDVAPRGTGILVSARAAGIRAKALTHATVKWPYLARAAGPGRHALRLSYGRPGTPVPDAAALPDLALREAALLLGVPLRPGQVVETVLRRWTSALPRPAIGHAAQVAALRAALPDGLQVIGATVAGTGLASVVADARTVATGQSGVGQPAGRQSGGPSGSPHPAVPGTPPDTGRMEQ